MTPIQFRCIRCQHPVEAPESAAGGKMYCPVCYLELRVPKESTVKPVDPNQLYEADAAPVDVREMKDRQSLVSLRCPVCHTNIAVSKEQVGTKVTCPECETKVLVPKEIAEKVDKAVEDRLDRIMQGLEDVSKKDTYGLRNAGDPGFADGKRLFSVNCKLCGTMMYASEDQVGQELICPDCETKTRVPPPPKTVPKPPPLPNSFEGGSTFGVAGDADAATPGTGKLVPVVCKLCATRMYARESEIGGFKTCPDCGVRTEIKAVPKEQMYEPEVFSGDGYGVNEAKLPPKRPSLRTLTDYRYIDGSLDREHYAGEAPPPEMDLDWDSTGRNPTGGHTKYPDDFDAEELRQRRALKMAGFSEDGYDLQPMQRLPLPEYPFFTRLLVCFKDAGLLGRTLASLLLALAGYLVGIMLPGLFVVVSAPFGGCCMVLGLGLMSNTLHSLFLWTAAGNDLPSRDDWMEYRFLDSSMFTIWLFLVTVLGAAPGYLLTTCLPHTPEQWEWDLLRDFFFLFGSAWFFFPILFLSSMEAGSYFALLARETCRSLVYRTGVWFRFYFLTGMLGAGFLFLMYLVTLIIHDPVGIFFLPLPILAVSSLLYFRLLGRLGWTLEELARQDAEAEEE